MTGAQPPGKRRDDWSASPWEGEGMNWGVSPLEGEGMNWGASPWEGGGMNWGTSGCWLGGGWVRRDARGKRGMTGTGVVECAISVNRVLAFAALWRQHYVGAVAVADVAILRVVEVY